MARTRLLRYCLSRPALPATDDGRNALTLRRGGQDHGLAGIGDSAPSAPGCIFPLKSLTELPAGRGWGGMFSSEALNHAAHRRTRAVLLQAQRCIVRKEGVLPLTDWKKNEPMRYKLRGLREQSL